MNRPKVYSKHSYLNGQAIKIERQPLVVASLMNNRVYLNHQSVQSPPLSQSFMRIIPQHLDNQHTLKFHQYQRTLKQEQPTAENIPMSKSQVPTQNYGQITTSFNHHVLHINTQVREARNQASQIQLQTLNQKRVQRVTKSESNSPEKQYRIAKQTTNLIFQQQPKQSVYSPQIKQKSFALEDNFKINKMNTQYTEDDDDEDDLERSQFQEKKEGKSNNSIDMSMQNSFERSRPIIQYSHFANREPTIFFQYPPICEKKRNPHFAKKMSEAEEKRYKLVYRVLGQVPYRCVVSSFEYAGFTKYVEEDEEEETTEGVWNIMWGIGNKSTLKHMNKYQKINHFPGCWNMGRKDNLWINLSKNKRKFPKDYDIVPNTYLLAYDYDRFLTQRDQAQKNQLWIMKPCAAARGKGIRMISKKSKVGKKKNYLIMDYISKPHLINGFKYDLRVYVLISGFDPLRVYIYNEGLARFATESYSVSQKDLTKKYIHLTNFAINKNSPNFVKNQTTDQDGHGSKWSHSALRKKYEEMGINHEALFQRVKDVVIKTCIASEPFMLDSNAKSAEHKNSFFELYGFDILIDQDLKPWVLEVNVCPSLNSSSPLDKKIKTSLISDILHLVGVPLWDKAKKKPCTQLIRVIIKDLVSPKQSSIFSRNINEIQNINILNCKARLTPDDWNTILTVKEEQFRCDQAFQCIFPVPETISYYLQFFEFSRYNNKLIERFYQDGQKWLEKWN